MNHLHVVLCTHDPRRDHLAATLDALRAQTLPPSEWELLVIDNASPVPLAAYLDLSWHPAVRIVREEKLGTAHARHRALREVLTGSAGLILFVDDDNVLAPDYLTCGLAIAAAWPQLGAWGGQLVPRYEMPPAPWLERYLNYLAVRPLPADQWTNTVVTYDSVPPTAGCFLRGTVALRYLDLLARDPRRFELGAKGRVQVRGEDTDLVLTAIDLGLGVGRFSGLHLTHLIPAARVRLDYVAGVIEGTAFGTGLIEHLRGRRSPSSPGKTLDRLLQRWRTWRLPEPHRTIRRAELRGRAAARALIAAWDSPVPPSGLPPRPCSYLLRAHHDITLLRFLRDYPRLSRGPHDRCDLGIGRRPDAPAARSADL